MDAELWELVVSCLPLMYQQIRRLGADEWQDDTVYDAALDGLINAARTYCPAKAKFVTYSYRGIGFGVLKGKSGAKKRRHLELTNADIPDLPAPEPKARLKPGPGFWQFRGLSETQRRVLELRFREGMTQREAAGRLGITRSRVGQHEVAARRALRRNSTMQELRGGLEV